MLFLIQNIVVCCYFELFLVINCLNRHYFYFSIKEGMIGRKEGFGAFDKLKG